MWLGLSVAVFYGAVSVAANFVNKYAVQVLPLPITVLIIQTLPAIILLRAMAAANLIQVPALRDIRATKLAPLSICYSVHALLVLYSLAFLTVPMYNTLKRLTPVMVLVAKAVMDRRCPDAPTTASVMLIVGGCLVAGAGDLDFHGQGYFLALLCAASQAAYILLAEVASGKGPRTSKSGSDPNALQRSSPPTSQELPDLESPAGGVLPKVMEVEVGYAADHPGRGKSDDATAHSTGVERCAQLHLKANATNSRSPVSQSSSPLITVMRPWGSGWGAGEVKDTGGAGPLSATELLYSISVISVPALCAVCVISGEGAAAPVMLTELWLKMGSFGFMWWMFVTAVTQGLLTGSILLCTQLNSALTTSIVGVLKGAVSSVLGFFLLGGVKFHAVNVAGIVLNMAGGMWYTAIKYVRSKGTVVSVT